MTASPNAAPSSPASSELSFDVEGMSCAACSRRVEKALGKAEGVREARVDLVRERAVIVLAEGASGEARLRVQRAAEEAVDKAGYRLVARRDVQAAAAPRAHFDAADRRVLVAWALTLAGFAAGLALPSWPWLEAGLATLVVIGPGAPVLRKALGDLRDRSAGMDVLVSVGALAALGSAFWGLARSYEHLAMGHSMGGAMGGGHSHSDASMAALIVSVSLLGKRIEHRAKGRAAEAIEALVRALPRTARVVRHGVEAELELAEVRPSDVVRVGAFARVPLDGELVAPEGEGAGVEDEVVSLDESVVTGESRPVERGYRGGAPVAGGVRVLGGSLNLARPFAMRVLATSDDSELARVIAAVSRAQSTKTAIVRTTDRLSAVFAPAVLVVASLTLAGYLVAGASFDAAFRSALAVVVVACPCALGLATPVAVTVAMGHLAGRGVLLRDAAILEALPRLRTLVFDKTGTLTAGAPRVVALVPASSLAVPLDALLAWCAAVEADSHHPLARAVFDEAMQRRLVVPRAIGIEETAGQGIRGEVDGHRVALRRPDPSHDALFDVTSAQAAHPSASWVEVVVDSAPALRLALEDALRPEARDVVDALRARGLRLVLRSGDDPGAVADAARTLGLDDARGGLRPEQKLDATLRAPDARPLAMIGDGINDAPALAEADVGFALGSRAQATLEAAGVALPRPDLRLVLHTLTLADRTLAVIRQNLVLAFAYNVVAIPFAASGSFEAIGGPAMAAVAMAMSSLLVVMNALRLRDTRPAADAAHDV